jgi:hypothetical protein
VFAFLQRTLFNPQNLSLLDRIETHSFGKGCTFGRMSIPFLFSDTWEIIKCFWWQRISGR